MLKLADTSLILINPSPSNVKELPTWTQAVKAPRHCLYLYTKYLPLILIYNKTSSTECPSEQASIDLVNVYSQNCDSERLNMEQL